eukprot:PLAT2504.3.p1 GENE.PLAT2504.3~~PLAT2504.3.p1  ORF type:complete len:336 (+),score=100.23 PLAT2504.3:102-1109(+)
MSSGAIGKRTAEAASSKAFKGDERYTRLPHRLTAVAKPSSRRRMAPSHIDVVVQPNGDAPLAFIRFRNRYCASLSVAEEEAPDRWRLLLSRWPLMDNPHYEGDAQRWHVLPVSAFVRQPGALRGPVLKLRFLLHQPSPLWRKFSLDSLAFFAMPAGRLSSSPASSSPSAAAAAAVTPVAAAVPTVTAATHGAAASTAAGAVLAGRRKEEEGASFVALGGELGRALRALSRPHTTVDADTTASYGDCPIVMVVLEGDDSAAAAASAARRRVAKAKEPSDGAAEAGGSGSGSGSGSAAAGSMSTVTSAVTGLRERRPSSDSDGRAERSSSRRRKKKS